MSKSKKSITTLAVIILFTIIGIILFKVFGKHKDYNNIANWITFTDPQNHFSLLLPDKPKVSTEAAQLTSTIPDGASYSVMIKSGGETPGGVSPLRAQVNNILAESSKSAKPASLIYADDHSDSSGTSYMDYKIYDSKGTKKGRMFLISGNIFVLLDSLPKGKNDDNLFNNFLASFQLTQ